MTRNEMAAGPFIATVIAYEMDDIDARTEAALAFADQLHILNCRFDEERFLRACLRRTDEWYWSDGRRWIGSRCADQSDPEHLRHTQRQETFTF